MEVTDELVGKVDLNSKIFWELKFVIAETILGINEDNLCAKMDVLAMKTNKEIVVCLIVHDSTDY